MNCRRKKKERIQVDYNESGACSVVRKTQDNKHRSNFQMKAAHKKELRETTRL